MKDPINDKDAESKRPPWRAVSISTLPKPDTNALLKAKLLDASRRMRAGRSSVSIQTDIVSTKVMKEMAIGCQSDLILYKEIGVLTDGSYTKKKEGSDEFILTYSVSQITDPVSVLDASTQTLIPKFSGDYFMEAYFASDQNTVNTNDLSKIERKLLDQVRDIRESKKLPENSVNEESGERNMVFNKAETRSWIRDYLAPQTYGKRSFSNTARPSLLRPTLSSWHFDYDEMEEAAKRSRSYIVHPYRLLNNFVPVSFGFDGVYLQNQCFDWKLLLIGIDQLIEESNRLVDLIDANEVKQNTSTALYERNLSLNVGPVERPSQQWLPIIEKQEKELEQMLNKLNQSKLREANATNEPQE